MFVDAVRRAALELVSQKPDSGPKLPVGVEKGFLVVHSGEVLRRRQESQLAPCRRHCGMECGACRELS